VTEMIVCINVRALICADRALVRQSERSKTRP